MAENLKQVNLSQLEADLAIEIEEMDVTEIADAMAMPETGASAQPVCSCCCC